ncbi:MAG: chemotaxis protein CheW [Candidatus Methanoperedens sp.]|nr:chemotaxis protein CheW [Candidatus Methanoperedens sp.]
MNNFTKADADDKRKLLKARAIALAKKPEKKEADEYIEVVEFQLAHEKYAIQSNYIREVYPLKELTPVPCTPQFVAGIINVRGKILSVIDIKKFFELPGKGITDLNKVIIIHNGLMEFGILADAVLGAGQIPRDIQASLPTLSGIRAEYLKGVTKEGVVVLDAEKILSDKKIIVHEEV